jgi:hypothetical protein
MVALLPPAIRQNEVSTKAGEAHSLRNAVRNLMVDLWTPRKGAVIFVTFVLELSLQT